MTDRTILIVDDSQAVCDHIRAALSNTPERFRVLTASNGLDGYRELVSSPVDLVLCDVTMPVLDGFKFLALKATRPGLREVPVIMLTSVEELHHKVKALEGGAADYLTKPFHDAELLARLRVHMNLRLVQQELRAEHQKLELLSNTDALTKLTNRRHFMELAEVELVRAAQENLSLAVVLMDVDHFKAVNDTHGHIVGDRTLESIAKVLRRDQRQRDVVARYGGEEFVILMPDTDTRGAVAVAERCRRGIAGMSVGDSLRVDSIRVGRPTDAGADSVEGPITIKSDARWSLEAPPPSAKVHVTASFGVAVFPELDARSVDDLVRLADRALYRAKAEGRDRVVVAGDLHEQRGTTREASVFGNQRAELGVELEVSPRILDGAEGEREKASGGV